MAEPTYIGGMIFSQAYRLVRLRIYNLLGKYDITPSHWSLLSIVLGEEDGIRAGTLAHRMNVKAPMVTILADELTEVGLIQKIPHHTDGRVRLLAVTTSGKKLANQIERELSSEIEGLLQGVSQVELKSFRKTLEAIIHNAS